jgi:hypothetical protein
MHRELHSGSLAKLHISGIVFSAKRTNRQSDGALWAER